MTEIILSFFSIIGIILLATQLCDFFFYRKYKENHMLLVDLREKNETETIEILELIATVRQRRSGRAAIGELMILSTANSGLNQDEMYHYLNIFGIPGTVYENVDLTTKAS